jgi:ribosome-interacting GTPase 1
MPIENVQVQLIDTPSLNPDFVEPQLMDLVRRADMVLIVVDLQAFPIQQLEDTVALLEEQRIVPQHLQERYDGQRRAIFLPFLVVVNKVDDESLDEDYEVLCELLEGKWPLIPLSAETGRNLEQLKRVVFDRLEIMRIYAKPPGKDPDLNEPFVMKKGSTVEEFAASVHQDFYEKLKSTRVWGSAEFEGQMVGRDYILQDGDIVELRI